MRSQKKCRTPPPESSFTGAAGTGASGRERAAPLFSWEACRAMPAGSGARHGMYVQSTGQLYLAAHSSTISTKLNFNSKKTSLQQAFKFKRCYISAEVIFFLNKWNVFFITLMDKWVLRLIYIVHHEASLTLDHIWMLTGNWSFSSQKETYLWSSEPNPTPAITAVQKEYDTLFPFVYFLLWVKWVFFPEKNIIFWYWFGITQFMFNT